MPPKPKTDNSAMQALKRDLRQGAPKNLYVFHGEEAYLREFYLGELRKAVLPAGLEDFNHHTAEGKDCWNRRWITCP